MNDSIRQRIMIILEHYGFSKNSFSKKIEMEQTTVNNQLTGKRSISIDLTSSILAHFPEISSEWLLRGEGEMLKNKSAPEKKKVLEDLPDLEKSGEVVKSLIDVINILAEQDKRLLNMKEKNAEMIQQLINMAEKIMNRDEALKKSQELAKAS